MTDERRYKRQRDRANKKHVPILTKLLVETVGHMHHLDENNIGSVQFVIEQSYQDWIAYCAQQKHFKGMTPHINAFVDNLIKMVGA